MSKSLAYGLLGVAVVALVGALWFRAASTSAPSAAPGILATTTPATASSPQLFKYIEMIDGCGPYWNGGACVNLRSGPGTEYPVVLQLRDGMVLKVASTTVAGGYTWYQIGFDGTIKYPERITGESYVAADYTRPFMDEGEVWQTAKTPSPGAKRIVIDLSQEVLYAYDGDTLFLKDPISTGLELTPTLVGTFKVFKKTPDSYMQGPIPGLSDQYYDLPGVPWDLYFTDDGAAIHGAYWHDHFGEPWSHGCVNLAPEEAKRLYAWADLGTPVIVQR